MEESDAEAVQVVEQFAEVAAVMEQLQRLLQRREETQSSWDDNDQADSTGDVAREILFRFNNAGDV